MERETLKLIKTIIVDGAMSQEDVDEIVRLVNQRKSRGGSKCITSAIEEELEKAKSLEEGKRIICQDILGKCFRNSEVGNMDALCLTMAKIKEFMEDTYEVSHLSDQEVHNFAALLQIGMKSLYREGLLQFTPEEGVIRKFLDSKDVTNYIRNPYTDEETEQILKWVEEHPYDVRAAALGIVLLGGISYAETVRLTEKDCWEKKKGAHGVKRPLGGMFDEERRCRIVKNALKVHPVVLGYVFAVQRIDGRGWDGLSPKGIAYKLSSICNEIGISYKKIYKNEIIMVKTKSDKI